MKKIILWILVFLLLVLAGIAVLYYMTRPPVESPKPPKEIQTGKLLYHSGKTPLVISGADYTTDKDRQKTNEQGEFNYQEGQYITLNIAKLSFTLLAKAEITLDDLVNQETQQRYNLARLLANLDQDNHLATGIQLDESTKEITIGSLDGADAQFELRLYQALKRNPKLAFEPTLGINTESPQAKADTVGQAIPFVDIFRTARPFSELSPKEVEYDKDGWPVIIPKGNFARTKLLQGTLKDAIPNGEYTVFYDGKGKVSFGSDALLEMRQISDNEMRLQIETKDAYDYTEANSLSVVINHSDPEDPVRNIRIIMPGGICRDAAQANAFYIDPWNSKDNPFLHIMDESLCPDGTQYKSFAELYRHNRNRIVFNPSYLQHLNHFRVIRLMNLMEASPSYYCRGKEDKAYEACLEQSINWKDRAKMSDMVWGASSRAAFDQRKGVPVEVLIALVNQLNRNAWVTMPHYADDEYVREFATYFKQHLNKDLKLYVEYSNETWNPGFQGHYFVKQRGLEADLGEVPTKYSFRSTRNEGYFAGLRYYVKRSLAIFDIWNEVFAEDANRLVKVISGQQGDTVLSEEMLKFEDAYQKVDALAIAPYFFGCLDRSSARCALAGNVLTDVESVDDIFDIVDHSSSRIGGDPSALEGMLEKVEKQAKVAQENGVQLLSYEGGQHLTIMGSMGSLDQERKEELRRLFREANRDPRMKERYMILLNKWKEIGETYDSVSLFTLYTMAQSFYDYGSWGLKESLTQAREDAPKYDAAMQFQEQVVLPWWKQKAEVDITQDIPVEPSQPNADKAASSSPS